MLIFGCRFVNCLHVFFQYVNELGCPYPLSERNALIDWLLGYAVRLEYGDDGEYTVLGLHRTVL